MSFPRTQFVQVVTVQPGDVIYFNGHASHVDRVEVNTESEGFKVRLHLDGPHGFVRGFQKTEAIVAVTRAAHMEGRR